MTGRFTPEQLGDSPIAPGMAGSTPLACDDGLARDGPRKPATGRARMAGRMSMHTSIALFLFFWLSLLLPSGYSLGAALLLAISLYHLAKNRPPTLPYGDRPLVAVFAAYFALCAASVAWHGGKVSELDIALRFLLAIPVFMLLRANPPGAAALWGGIALGSIGGGAYAAWQFAVLEIARPGGHTNPIQFGNLCVVFAMLCLSSLSWAKAQPRARAWTALMMAGAVSGLMGAILSGSRGSWIAVPLCTVFLLAFSGRAARRYQLASLAGAALLVMLAAVSYKGLGLEQRLQQTVSEARGYFESGSADNSVGGRLEMWRTGLRIAAEKPVFGWGSEGYQQRKAALVAAGLADPYVMQHSHAHNEFIDAMVKRGALGLAALLALYLVPLRFFARALRRADSAPVRPYALGGVLVIACYMAFGLTQAFLTHNNGAMSLAFILAALWASIEPARAPSTSSE